MDAHGLIDTITSPDPGKRNRSFFQLCEGLAAEELLEACEELERFRRASDLSLIHI